jgi:hypothetical protein
MPHPAGVGINSEDTRSSAIRAAASATGVVGSAVTGSRRTSDPTGASRGSAAPAEDSAAEVIRRRMLPMTNETPASDPSRGSAVSGGTR